MISSIEFQEKQQFTEDLNEIKQLLKLTIFSTTSDIKSLKVVEETMNKLFGLIHSIPDSILQWIGGGLSRSMGDYANGIEGGSSHTTEKIGGGSKQAVMSMSSASTRGVQRAQELRERNEEKTTLVRPFFGAMENYFQKIKFLKK